MRVDFKRAHIPTQTMSQQFIEHCHNVDETLINNLPLQSAWNEQKKNAWLIFNGHKRALLQFIFATKKADLCWPASNALYFF